MPKDWNTVITSYVPKKIFLLSVSPVTREGIKLSGWDDSHCTSSRQVRGVTFTSNITESRILFISVRMGGRAYD
jgi:hypothetical protein